MTDYESLTCDRQDRYKTYVLQKWMSKMAGKPGKSGRKPKGEFSKLSSSLTIRIPDDMRKQLESEATESGESVAQVLLWHLRQSFNRNRELEREPAMRALCFLIAELAHNVSSLIDGRGRPLFDWRSDPFFFRAFKLAVAQLLDALEPGGEIEPPELILRGKKIKPGSKEGLQSRFVRTYETPEARAETAVRTLLSMLQRAPHLSWITEKYDPHFKALWRRREYGLADARRDLEFDPIATKPEGKGND